MTKFLLQFGSKFLCRSFMLATLYIYLSCETSASVIQMIISSDEKEKLIQW